MGLLLKPKQFMLKNKKYFVYMFVILMRIKINYEKFFKKLSKSQARKTQLKIAGHSAGQKIQTHVPPS